MKECHIFFQKLISHEDTVNKYPKSKDAYITYCTNYIYYLLKSYAMRYKFVTIKDLQVLSTSLSTTFSTRLWISIPSACLKSNILHTRAIFSPIPALSSQTGHLFRRIVSVGFHCIIFLRDYLFFLH